LIFAIPSSLRAADIFKEAEEASDTNMTTDGTFRAFTPDESSKLSGGRWLNGKVGDETLHAAYSITVPEAGAYRLYLRKYWQHGAFQWRVDQGDWQQLRKADLLDSVVMREYVPISWVFAGDVELTAGEHEIRFEVTADPSYEYSKAFGFDCFLLTRGELTDYLQAHPELGAKAP
jgi:hypothetical protein